MMSKHAALALTLAAAALAGSCASSRPVHPALAAESAPGGDVVLIRESGGTRAKAPVQVLLDDQPIAALVSGNWTRLHLVPGAHELAVASVEDPERRPNFQTAQPGYVRETSGVGPAKTVRVEVAGGDTHYVLLRYDRTDTSRRSEGQGRVVDTRVLFSLEQMAESTARARMDEYREVSVEHP